MTTLIYIADPMCSWCYGFGNEFATLMQGLPDVPVEIVVGGLRAYERTPIDEAQRATVLSHWQKVEAATGLPFADGPMQKEGFIYDTEPACRAVVTARRLAPQTSFLVLYALQNAFYAEGRDITQTEVLTEIAASAMTAGGHAIDAATFAQAFAEDATILATHADFELVQQWGIYGFPTLILERDGKLDLVSAGYLPVDQVVEKLQALVDEETPAEEAVPA